MSSLSQVISAYLTITHEGLALIISNCDLIGFKYTRKHHEFIPEDITPTAQEEMAFFDAPTGPLQSKDANKFVSKFKQLPLKRKFITAHLFESVENTNVWHILFFDRKEIIEPKGKNHYKDGEHIHFISHLFGNQMNKLQILVDLENNKSTKGSEHIKYVPGVKKPAILKGRTPNSKILVSGNVDRLVFDNHKDPHIYYDPDREEICQLIPTSETS